MASGDSLAFFTATQAAFTGSSRAGGGFDADYGYFMAFDPSADEQVVFQGVLGRNYAGGGVTIKALVLMDSANTSANVVVGAAFQSLGDGADLSGAVSWDENTAVNAVPDAAETTREVTIDFSDGVDMDELAAGEPFRLRFRRVGTNGSDDASGDMRLLALECTETQ